MAKKPPETVDRFRIIADVQTEEQLGSVMAQMMRMGVQHVHYELITDVLNFKTKKFETSSVDVLREWIKEHPTFSRAEALAHFIELGRTKEGGSNAIFVLTRQREIKALGEGNYQRFDVKAIAAPKPKAAKPPTVRKAKPLLSKAGKPLQRKPNAVQKYDVSNIDFLMRKVRNRQKFTVKEMEAYFTANGRVAKSVSPVLLKLVNLHKVRRLDGGEYSVIHGSAAKPQPNGAVARAPESSAADEVVTNG